MTEQTTRGTVSELLVGDWGRRFNRTIFLNFAGAENRTFHGPETVRGITIEPAALSAREIAGIVSELNEEFAPNAVTFTARRPVAGEYATVQVGKTADFDRYGDFLGLAEIGGGQAFVLAHKLTRAELSGVIAHESRHLLGFRHRETTGTLADCALINVNKPIFALSSEDDVVIFAGTPPNFTDRGSINNTSGKSGADYALAIISNNRTVTVGGNVSINGIQSLVNPSDAADMVKAIDFGGNSGTVAFSAASGAGTGADVPVNITATNAYLDPNFSNPSHNTSIKSRTECSATGVYSTAAMTVNGSLSGNVTATSVFGVTGYHQFGDWEKPVDNASSNTVSAYGFRNSSLTVTGELSGVMNSSTKLVAAGFNDATAKDNVVDAAAIRVDNEFSTIGRLSGTLTAKNLGNSITGNTADLYEDAEKKNNDQTKKGAADVSGNTFTAAGIAAASIVTGNEISEESVISVATSGTVSGVSNTIVKGDASVNASGNTFEAYGLQAAGEITLNGQFAGSIDVTTTGSASGSALPDGASEESAEAAGAGSVDNSNNTFSAVGISGTKIVFQNDFTGTLTVKTEGTLFAQVSGYNHTGDSQKDKTGTLDLSENTASAVGLLADEISISGNYAGTIRASSSLDQQYSISGPSPEITAGNNLVEAYGIWAKNQLLVTGDPEQGTGGELGGLIQAELYDIELESGAGSEDSNLFWSSGLRTASLQVGAITGTVTSWVRNSSGGQIVSNAIYVDDSGDGVINGGEVENEDGTSTIKALEIAESARIVGLTDNGWMTHAIVGGQNGVNLKISGTLFAGSSSLTMNELLNKLDLYRTQRYDYTDTAAIDLRNELNSAGSGEALNTYQLADDGDTTFTNARDEVELTKTAVLWGNVDLQAGNNFIDIDSRAQLFGDLSASFGTLNVQFNLRGDISPGAIISTNRNYGATSEQNVTEKSVTTFTVDLETIAGTGSEEPEDPDLITQAGTYVLIDGDLTDGWVWRDVSLYYKGEIAHVQINGDEYTFSDGTRVSAIFVDIDGPYNLINRESIQLVVTAADGSSAVEVAEIATPVNNNGLVTVTWSEVPNAVAYTLQYATSEDFSDALQYTTNREAAENLNRAQLQLNSGEEYYFRVMAVTADGQRSDWKALPESFLVDTAADTTAPTAPSILTGMSQAGADGTGADLLNAGSCGEGVYLDWSDVTDASGVKAYVVEWKLASDADWSNAQSLEVTATEVVTTKTVGAVYESSRVVSSVVLDGSLLESGESYNWRVKAVDCNGNGAGDEGNWAYGDDFTYEESAAPNDPGNARFDLEGSVATLTWSAVQDDNGNPANNIRKYLIEYSQDSEFRSGVIRKEVTGNELIASGLTNYAFYYWRVKAVDNQGNQSNWVYGDSFLVYVKDESGPSAPSDLLATPDQLNVTLSWTPSSDGDPEAGDKYQSGLKGYILTYADNAAFENEIIISVTADEFGAEAPTSYTLENLSNDVEAYYWTLQAIDWAGNVSAVTTGDSFYVDTIPPEGLNNATLTVTGSTETGATLDFTWDVATDNRPGDVVYNLTFSDTADFSNVLGTYEGTTNSYSQSFSTEEVDLKTIYWKVTATDARENVTPALEGSTAVDLVDDTLPGAVTGVVGPAAIGPYNFVWDEVIDNKSNPCDYLFTFADNANFTTTEDGASKCVSITVSTTGVTQDELYSVWGSSLDEATTYYWKVQAVDQAGNIGPESTVDSFTVTPLLPPVTLNPAATLESDEQKSYLLSWGASPSAEDTDILGYEWQLSDAAFTVDGGTAGTMLWGGGTTDLSVSVSGLEDLTTYYWRVRTIVFQPDDDRASSWITGSFTTNFPTAPGEPDELSVTVVSNSNLAYFSWSPSVVKSGWPVDYYVVEIATDASFLDSTSIQVSSGTALPYSDLQECATYYWRLYAVNSYGYRSQTVQGENFTTYDITPPSEPSGLSAELNRDAVTLSWSASADAHSGVEYLVELSTDPQFSRIFKSTTTSDLSCTIDGLGDTTTYYWRVRAIDTSENQNTSAAVTGQSFTTGDLIPPETPRSLQSSLNETTATLSWRASTDDKSGIAYYVVEYSFDRKFSEFTQVRTEDTTLVLEDLEPMKTYYWRVRAVDGAGNVSEAPRTPSSFMPLVDSGNDFGNAKEVSPNQTIIEDVGGAGDAADYFKFTLDEEEAGLFRFTATASTGKVNLTLYRADTKKISYKNGAEIQLDKGTYYVAITSGDKSQDYYTFTATGAYFPSDLSDNQPGTATAINLGESASDWVGYTDAVDFYKFTTGDLAGEFTFSLSAGDLEGLAYNEKNLRLAFGTVNSKGTFVAKKTVSSLSDLTTTQLLDANTTYYLKVYSADNGKKKNSTYTLSVDGGYFDLADLDNNTLAEAKKNPALTIGSNLKSWVGYSDALDYYRFEVTAVSGSYSFTITDPQNQSLAYLPKNLKLYIGTEGRTGAFKTVATGKYSSKTGTIELDRQLETGTYFIKVRSSDNGKKKNSTYELTVEGQNHTLANRNNDTTLEAMQLTPLAKGSETVGWIGYGDKVDYYAFTVDDFAGNFTFTLQNPDDPDFAFNAKNLRFKIGIVSAKGTFRTLKSGKVDSAAGQVVISGYDLKTSDTLKEGETYMIKVYSPYLFQSATRPERNSSYELVITANDYTKADHTNDTLAQASTQQAMKSGDSVTGWVGFSDAADYYKFQLDSDGKALLSLTNVAAKQNLKLTVYDEKGRSMGSLSSSAILKGNTLLTKELEAGVSYYAAITSTNEKKYMSDYSFSIFAVPSL